MIIAQVLQELSRLLLLILLVELLYRILVLLLVFDARIILDALDGLEVAQRVESPVKLLQVLVLLLNDHLLRLEEEVTGLRIIIQYFIDYTTYFGIHLCLQLLIFVNF